MKIKDNTLLYFLVFIVLVIVFIQLSITFAGKKSSTRLKNQTSNTEKLSEPETKNKQVEPVEIENIEPVLISNPNIDDKVTSPLMIEGKALKSWFFEGVLPIEILDENGQQIVSVVANADTTPVNSDYIDFKTIAKFTTNSATGTLVVNKNNPSDLPENDESYAMTISFK